MLAEGTLAPDFLSGDWKLLEQLISGPLLVVFFKISCPTSQLTFPFLQRLMDQAKPAAPRLITISQDDLRSTAAFQQHFKTSLPVLIDEPPYRISSLFQIRHVPSLFLIEPDNLISLAVSGFSKAHIEALGERFGAIPFLPSDRVPAMRPG